MVFLFCTGIAVWLTCTAYRRCVAEYWPVPEPGRFKAHWRTVLPFETPAYMR